MISDRLNIVTHPLIQHKLTEMRRKDTPTNHFRQLLREISLLLAYEVTRELPLSNVKIETPLMETEAPSLDGKKLALVSILRAGNGLLDGVLDLIPSARVGFVGLYRDEKTLKPIQYYYKVHLTAIQKLHICLLAKVHMPSSQDPCLPSQDIFRESLFVGESHFLSKVVRNN